MIHSIQSRGYKAFSQPLDITLRPITVFFGKNNSGKTTLVRLPILVAASLTNSDSLFSLSAHGLSFGASFTDLTNASDPHPSLSLGIQWSRTQRLAVVLQHVTSQQDNDSVQPSFIQVDRTRRPIELRRRRAEAPRDLLGSVLTSSAQQRLDKRINALRALLDQLIHIHSARPRIQAIYSTRSPAAWVTDEVPYILCSTDRLLDDVNRWFQQHLDQTGVGVDQAAFAFRIVETRKDSVVNFVQSGRGPQAALPVVTLLLALASGIKRCPLLVVEEPEAHLHPSVHGDIADLVINCAAKTQIIVETHSENFLLRLRRRIAEGIISHDDIALYFIDDTHEVFRIVLDQYGTTDQWPTGIFEGDIEEARAIVEAKISAMTDLGQET